LLARRFAEQLGRPTGLAGRVVGAMLNRGNAKLNAAAREALKAGSGDRVLELGFGGGADLRALLDAGVERVVGVDVSGDMVAAARKRYAGEVGLELHEASVDALPLGDGAVTRAISIHTIYFWPDAAAGARELRRVVAPGGRLVLGFQARSKMEGNRIHRHGFTLYEGDEVAALLRDAGFAEVGVRPAAGALLAVAG
jgi:arsenite methyltransferase